MPIPVSLDDAKRQLRMELDEVERDDEINSFIADAAAWIEEYTGHILVARDVTEAFRGFRPVTMRAWPIAAAAVPGLAYIDGSGNAASLTGIRLDISRDRARILPSDGVFFPFSRMDQPFTVTIRAGYEDGDTVPGNIRRAMLVLIAAYDDDREGGDAFRKAEATARKLCGGLRPRAL